MSGHAGERLRICGKVQGVGFRPWVWRLAQQLALCGEVCNDAAGVEVRLVGNADALIALMHQHCPPLARIDHIERQSLCWTHKPDDFQIIASQQGSMNTQIAPDAASCPACLQEMYTATDRRYRYPFINCTHCGPRFTIIKQMPYDRASTVMAGFPLCAACAAEYRDCADRRFHAEPVACPACGPQLCWQVNKPVPGIAEPLTVNTARAVLKPASQILVAPLAPVAFADAALQAAAQALLAGDIVAVKGLGGFHLACDASNLQAIARLRQRKQRPDKPLAVMLSEAMLGGAIPGEAKSGEVMAGGAASAGTTPLPASVIRLLTSPAAPIVLVRSTLLPAGLFSSTDGAPSLAACQAALAPGLREIGIMLPNNPLQHLLMQAVQRPLVMTSGNASGAAPAISNEQALASLATIADGFLLHDRDIVQRMDDSLVRPLAEDGPCSPVTTASITPLNVSDGSEMLRRARGYVPDAMPLPAGFCDAPSVLALGGDLKNTFCVLRGDHAIISQHFGDLNKPDIAEQWRQALRHFADLYHFQPHRVAVDAHPAYYSHHWGQHLGVPVQEVLHHHAHAVACLAEHGWPLQGGAVIALTLDGIGYGAQRQDAIQQPVDGEPHWWGGECLRVDYRHCQHLGGLPAVALPGGDVAARQPWRNLLAQCDAFVEHWQDYPETAVIRRQPWQPLLRALHQGVNCPRASSAGRLFDAVAAALGFHETQTYEGQAACWLEALAWQSPPLLRHPVMLPCRDGQLDLARLWQSWLHWQAPAAQRAWGFHDALAAGFAALARYHARRFAIETVVCSGGVLHNSLLRQRLAHWLTDFRVLFPARLPAGDGAISFGQAMIVAATVQERVSNDHDYATQ